MKIAKLILRILSALASLLPGVIYGFRGGFSILGDLMAGSLVSTTVLYAFLGLIGTVCPLIAIVTAVLSHKNAIPRQHTVCNLCLFAPPVLSIVLVWLVEAVFGGTDAVFQIIALVLAVISLLITQNRPKAA